ncbi:META domain-containing protein [Bacteroidales bacterium OttesenSCG-928-I21]|nr:META domain-containing protein [Bacteroidales bacterium OttesenSCG-928-I21]
MKTKKFIPIMIVLIVSLVSCNTNKSVVKTESKNVENSDSQKTDKKLVEKYWKLDEIGNEKIEMSANSSQEPHIIFKSENNRIAGNSGCNNIMSSYKIGENGEITILDAASTMKMCMEQDMNIERRFLQLLKNTKSYSIKNDILILYDTEKKQLAKFSAVYM